MPAGKYLGQSKELSRTVTPGRVHLLAALPYRVTGINLSVPAHLAPGDRLEYAARILRDDDGAAPVLHVFRVELVDPRGRPADHYASNLNAPDGRAQSSLNFALNEQPGAWTLTVRDVATGVTAQTSFVVR